MYKRQIKDDLAGIIVEPVLGGAGCIPPEEGYLIGLQEFARKNASVFILDEIVTGFRLSLGGAIDYYKLDPDLFTLGKIVGGGMPIGVLCGKREIMSHADPVKRNSKQSCCAIGGGTFSAKENKGRCIDHKAACGKKHKQIKDGKKHYEFAALS